MYDNWNHTAEKYTHSGGSFLFCFHSYSYSTIKVTLDRADPYCIHVPGQWWEEIFFTVYYDTKNCSHDINQDHCAATSTWKRHIPVDCSVLVKNATEKTKRTRFVLYVQRLTSCYTFWTVAPGSGQTAEARGSVLTGLRETVVDQQLAALAFITWKSDIRGLNENQTKKTCFRLRLFR